MIAVYMRVSKGNGQDLASQESELRRWAANQDGQVKFYADKFTGKTMDRPGMQKLWADVQAGQVKTVCVWRLDRLGRTVSGLTSLFDELRRLKVNLVSLRDGFDLGTAAGRLMANVIASVAAYETEIRAERVRSGLEVARAKGKRLGPAPGSRKGKRLHVTSEKEAAVRKLKADGATVSAISRAVSLSRVTVYSILRS